MDVSTSSHKPQPAMPASALRCESDLEQDILRSAMALADQTSPIHVAARLRELAEMVDPQE